MNINDIVINIRTRSTWQAVNLGVVIARSWYWTLVLSWLLPAGIFALIVGLAVPSLSSWLPILMVWWLKPFWDRGPLFIASRKLFNHPVNLLDFFKALPGLYAKDGLSWLTLRRFSPTRSYDLPVTCLEGLTGDERKRRLDVLHREGKPESILMFLLLINLEIVIVAAFVLVAFLCVPESIETGFLHYFEHQLSLNILIYNLLYFSAMAMIGPFYVVCGFAQYINRRVGIEGWGIELRFRELLNNHKSAAEEGSQRSWRT